eukprot:526870-Rhodomonas_salina.1
MECADSSTCFAFDLARDRVGITWHKIDSSGGYFCPNLTQTLTQVWVDEEVPPQTSFEAPPNGCKDYLRGKCEATPLLSVIL